PACSYLNVDGFTPLAQSAHTATSARLRLPRMAWTCVSALDPAISFCASVATVRCPSGPHANAEWVKVIAIAMSDQDRSECMGQLFPEEIADERKSQTLWSSW